MSQPTDLKAWVEPAELFIHGQWRAPQGFERIPVQNPATEQVFGSVPAGRIQDMHDAITAARQAFDTGPWPHMTPARRASYLERMLELYEGYFRTTMAALITAENGSPVSFTAQTEHPAAILRYYIEQADRFHFDVEREGYRLQQVPVGVVGMIVPWNMPQKTIMMKLAPALLAGCTVVVKPAPQTPLNAFLLAEIIRQAGVPDGVVNVVPALPEVAEYLVTHSGVDKIAFTGSTTVGRRIAALCGDSIRRCSLELGGKSAALACEHANPQEVVASLKADTFTLSGQICSAHTRLLVPQEQEEEYAGLAVELAQSLVVGPPTDPATDIGPLISKLQRGRVQAYVDGARLGGAKLAAGGERVKTLGFYLTPTVLTNVGQHMTIAREEVFGPVLAIMPYRDEPHAVHVANATDYGLEAAVWCPHRDHAEYLASRMRAGTVRINGAPAPVDAPLGGFKRSGIGRELGPEGLHSFLEPKTWIG